jgi:hypothetical protein
MKNTITIILILFALKYKAQNYVSIPDANFVSYLQQNYPSCMNGNQMDTTCLGIVNATYVSVNSLGISDLTGIQYFKNLKVLYCEYNQLTNLPELSDSLTFLNCDHNQLTSLTNLSAVIYVLYCAYNQLTSLPNLPNSLLDFKCHYNQLTTLPNLPDSLLSLVCGSNQLTSLPDLPNTLTFLSCHNNQLTSLPQLSPSLITLYCSQNQLTNLPNLPSSLLYLSCSENQLSTLPTLPSLLQTLDCQNNQLLNLPNLPDSLLRLWCHDNIISCFPFFPNSIENLNISNNPYTCLPNHISAMNSATLLIPICEENDIVNNPNGCSSYTETNLILNKEFLNFKVYPNPFSSSTTVAFGQALTNTDIHLFDVYGQEVRRISNFSGTKLSLQKENLNAGIYFLQIKNEQHSQKIKLIIAE